MVEYGRASGTLFSLRHNARRAAKAIPGAVVFPDGEGFRWGVPVGAEAEQQDAHVQVFLAGQEPDPAAIAEQRAADASAFDDPAEVPPGPPAEVEPTVGPALVRRGSTVVQIFPQASNEVLAQAAREHAPLVERSAPEVAWLLRVMADRLSAPTRPRAAPLRSSDAKVVRPRGPKAPLDPANPPVITSPTNQGVQRLIEKIAAARGDLAKLRSFDFKPSSTYYALAHRYLLACIAEADGAAALTE